MSVKVHEAFCFDSFQDRLLFFDDFHGDQIQDEWNAAGTGSVAVVDQQTGGIVRITTGAVTNNAYYIDWNDIRSLLVSKRVSMEFRLKLTQTTNIWSAPRLYFNASNYIGFRFNTGSDTNWMLRCVNGGAATSNDSGIAPDTSYHIFRIEAFPTDEVHFYIDGTECGNSPITTNIPDDAADYLQPWLYLRTLEDLAKSMDIDYVYIREDR